MMRVVMKPLITSMPLVGGLQVFFLNNPAIDFNLVGVADVLDMPGLRYAVVSWKTTIFSAVFLQRYVKESCGGTGGFYDGSTQ